MRNPEKLVEYEFTIPYGETAIEIGVHGDNSIREPRLRWRSETGTTGAWALLYTPSDFCSSEIAFTRPSDRTTVTEPEIRFGRFGGETITIDGEPVDSLPVTRETANTIAERLARFGRHKTDETIERDPEAFPLQIHDTKFPGTSLEWTRVGWDEEHLVMWYDLANFMELAAKDPPAELKQEAATAPRAYQIENGELIWRKHILSDIGLEDLSMLDPI